MIWIQVLYAWVVTSSATSASEAASAAEMSSNSQQCFMQVVPGSPAKKFTSRPESTGEGHAEPPLVRPADLELLQGRAHAGEVKIPTLLVQFPDIPMPSDLPMWWRTCIGLLSIAFTAGGIGVCTAQPPEGMVAAGTDADLEQLEERKRQLEAKKLLLEEAIQLEKQGGGQQEAPLSDAALQAKVEQVTLEVQAQANHGLRIGVMAAGPAITKVQRVKRVVEGRLDDANTKAREHVSVTGWQVLRKIMNIMGLDDELTSFMLACRAEVAGLRDSATALEQGSTGSCVLPPWPLVFAGLFAPIRLQFLIAWHRTLLLLTEALLLALAGVMPFDAGFSCGTNAAWYWAGGMASLLLISALCRIVVVNMSVAGLRSIQHVGPAPVGGDVKSFVEAVRVRVITSSGDFFNALEAYDRATNSAAVGAQNFLSLLCFLWGGFSVHWSIKYVVEDDTCDAQALRLTMHIFAFFYVMFFIWALVCVAICLGVWVVNRRMASNTLLNYTRELDSELCAGLPVISMCLRVFFASSVQDLVYSESADAKDGVDKLKKKQKSLVKEAKDIDSELAAKAQRLEKATGVRMEEEEAIERLLGLSEVTQTAEDASQQAKDLALRVIRKARDAGVDVEGLAAKVKSEGAIGQRPDSREGERAEGRVVDR